MNRIFACLFLVLGLVVQAQANTIVDEVKQIREEVKAAFLTGDFEMADRIVENYRRDDARTSTGTMRAVIAVQALTNSAVLYGSRTYETLSRMEKQAEKWITQRPDSTTARIVKAAVMSNRAWMVRGDGYINTLSPEALQGFYVYAGQAKDYLDSVKKASVGDPEWYASMMGLEMALPSPGYRFDELAEEALEAHPGYHGIYWSMVLQNLPVWGGSRESMEYWVDRIAQASGSDEGYARAYWYAAQIHFQYLIDHDTDADWDRMKAGFAIILRDYPSNWNLNNYAVLACQFQDKATAGDLLKRIGGDIMKDAWYDADMVERCREWAATPDPVLPPMQEWFLVVAYSRNEQHVLVPRLGPVDHPNAEEAVSHAEQLAASHDGVQAYKLVPNERTGNYERPVILFESGTIPDRPLW